MVLNTQQFLTHRYTNNLVVSKSILKRGLSFMKYRLNHNSLAQLLMKKLVLVCYNNIQLLKKITCHQFEKRYHHWWCTWHKLIQSILLLHYDFHILCFQRFIDRILYSYLCTLFPWLHRYKNNLLLSRSIQFIGLGQTF